MKKILIVDDEPDVVELLSYLLTDAGYEVHVAVDAPAALQKLLQVRVQLVVTDIMMPAMDGYELAEAIRSQPALSRLPILAMSAAVEVARREPRQLFDEFLPKPFRIDELNNKVAELLE